MATGEAKGKTHGNVIRNLDHARELIEAQFPGASIYPNPAHGPDIFGNYKFWVDDQPVELRANGKIVERSLFVKTFDRLADPKSFFYLPNKWAFTVCFFLVMIFLGLMAFGSFFNENIPMACTYFVGALVSYWIVKWMDPKVLKEKREASFEGFHEFILHGPSSSLIPYHKARKIAGKFGDLVAELCAPNRFTTSADIQNKKMHTMPVEHLGYSKEQVQTALAVVIAEMVVVLATKPSDEDERYLRAAATASSELGRFYRQPEGWKNFSFECKSTDVYSGWVGKCEDCWGKLVAAQPALLKEDPHTSVPWGMALTEYWKQIDRMIPELLKDPWLTAIREA